jgi:hypothetical protein
VQALRATQLGEALEDDVLDAVEHFPVRLWGGPDWDLWLISEIYLRLVVDGYLLQEVDSVSDIEALRNRLFKAIHEQGLNEETVLSLASQLLTGVDRDDHH